MRLSERGPSMPTPERDQLVHEAAELLVLYRDLSMQAPTAEGLDGVGTAIARALEALDGRATPERIASAACELSNVRATRSCGSAARSTTEARGQRYAPRVHCESGPDNDRTRRQWSRTRLRADLQHDRGDDGRLQQGEPPIAGHVEDELQRFLHAAQFALKRFVAFDEIELAPEVILVLACPEGARQS